MWYETACRDIYFSFHFVLLNTGYLEKYFWLFTASKYSSSRKREPVRLKPLTEERATNKFKIVWRRWAWKTERSRLGRTTEKSDCLMIVRHYEEESMLWHKAVNKRWTELTQGQIECRASKTSVWLLVRFMSIPLSSCYVYETVCQKILNK